MQTTEVDLDRELFSRDVVVRVAHRYTDLFTVTLDSTPTHWRISITPHGAYSGPEDIRDRVLRDALDENLRESVRSQTVGLQSVLIDAALRGAKPETIGK